VGTWVRTCWTSVIRLSVLLNNLQTSQKKLSLEPRFLMLLSCKSSYLQQGENGFIFFFTRCFKFPQQSVKK